MVADLSHTMVKFMRIQSKNHDDVFKPQAADDLRGKI